MESFDIGSNSTLRLSGVNLTTDIGTSPVADASVLFTMFDSDGSEMPGQTWPATLIPTATPGEYIGGLEPTIAAKHNWVYATETITTTPSGVIMRIVCDMQAVDRSCCK
jgi:hypothetical protein